MIKLYDFVDILEDEHICVVDLNGLCMESLKDEVKSRFNNNMITKISSDFSQSGDEDILNFVYIDGYCINED